MGPQCIPSYQIVLSILKHHPLIAIFLSQCFTLLLRCILDGEMLVWDATMNRFAEFGSNQEIGWYLSLNCYNFKHFEVFKISSLLYGMCFRVSQPRWRRRDFDSDRQVCYCTMAVTVCFFWSSYRFKLHFFLVQLCCILSPPMSTAMAALGAKPDSHYLSFDTLLLQLHSTIK